MKTNFKTVLAVTLAAMLLLSAFAGCSTGPGSSKKEIVGWVGSSPETLDPCMNSAVDGATYLVHLAQGLYRYKWDGTGIEMGDAASVDVSADGLVWTFTLRDDIKWSDGQKITAQDYEYSWKRVCDPDVAGPYSYDMAEFIENGEAALDGECPVSDVSVKALDEKTFQVTLSSPCPFFDQIAVFPTLYPVRQDVIESKGDNWWTSADSYVSNGPYKMESFSLDENMILVKNDNYYDKGKVKAETINWKFLADDSVALTAFRAGELDLGSAVPPVEIPALLEEGVLYTLPELGTYYLSFNCEAAPFDNPLVRKAFTLAIDRDYIANTVMQGTFVPATAIVGPGFGDVDPAKDFRSTGGDLIGTDYKDNILLAQQALAEAGYPDGEGFPVVEYMHNPSVTHQTVAEVLVYMWQEVLGIRAEIVVQEWAVFLETRRLGNFQVARDGWISDWNDASSMLNLFTSTSGNNNCQYKNPAFDAFISTAANSNDRSVRIEALHNAEKAMMNDWACSPIMHYAQNYIASKDLKNWHSSGLGYTFLHLANK